MIMIGRFFSFYRNNNNTNYENYNTSKDTATYNNSSSDLVNFDSYDFNLPFTKVYYGSKMQIMQF